MYSQAPVSGKNWHPIEPEDLSPAGSGAKADPNGSDFRLLYEPPHVRSAGQEFIPLFVDSSNPADAAKDLAAEEEPVQGNGSKEEAPPDPEEIRESAYAEGFSAGETAGFEAGRRNAGEIVARLQSLLQEMEGLWDRLVSANEEKILQLVLRISERIVCGNAAADPETVKRVILDAFRTIPEPVEVTIDIHPEDAEYIERVKEAFFQENKGLKSISLVSDPAVGRGGCRLKTRFGEVDAALETRLEAVRQAVMNAYRNKGENGRSL